MNKIVKILKMPFIEKKILIRRKLLSKLRWGFKSFGRNSDIYKPIILYNKKHISIGENVLIRNSARIEPVVEWNGIKYNPNIEISDNVSIEQNLHLTCANHVYIGENTSILPNVMITDIDHKYTDDNNIMMQGIEVQETIIGASSFIGKNACIMAGVKLGDHVIVGANAVVTHDFPGNSVVAGVPAKVIKTLFSKEENI